MNNGWQVKISTSVCEALDVKLYSTLPPVINELISNSYDADATRIILTKSSRKAPSFSYGDIRL